MIETLAARAVARLLDRLAAQAAADLPGIGIAREDDRIVLTGPGIVLRSLTDARLRGLAAMARCGGDMGMSAAIILQQALVTVLTTAPGIAGTASAASSTVRQRAPPFPISRSARA